MEGGGCGGEVICGGDWLYRAASSQAWTTVLRAISGFEYGMLRRAIKSEINAIATLMLLFSIDVASLGLYPRRRNRRGEKKP